jgi:hypothetical protein
MKTTSKIKCAPLDAFLGKIRLTRRQRTVRQKTTVRQHGGLVYKAPAFRFSGKGAAALPKSVLLASIVLPMVLPFRASRFSIGSERMGKPAEIGKMMAGQNDTCSAGNSHRVLSASLQDFISSPNGRVRRSSTPVVTGSTVRCWADENGRSESGAETRFLELMS